MSIRWKVGIIIATIFLVLEGVNLGVQRFIMLPTFTSLEKEEAIKDAKRVEEAINREFEFLDSLAHDWAAWDDTYRFVAAPHRDYMEKNLTPSVFKDNHLNLICIYTTERRLVWRGMNDVTLESRTALTDIFGETLPEDHPLLDYVEEAKAHFELSVSGVYMTTAGPLAVSARPILDSNNLGPVRGTLILAYFIDDLFVENIASQTQVEFELFPFREGNIADNLSVASGSNVGKGAYLIDESKNVPVLKIYTVIQDIEGRNALVMKGRIERKIMEKGCITMRYAVASLMISGAVALVVMMFLIQWAVLKPIGKLTANVVGLKGEENEFGPSFSKRGDEIGFLNSEFENLITELHNRSMRLEELNTALFGDIEKRKQAEAALRESEDRFKALLENLPAGVFVHDLKGKFLFVNDVACANTGYNREELLSITLGNIIPNKAAWKENERIWEKMCEGIPIVVQTEKTRKDGSTYPTEVHLTKIVLEGRPIIMALAYDITERKKAEEALRISKEKLARSRNMESLGLLAGGVAHDLNNVLSGIVSYPELILMDLPEDSKLVNPLKTMQTSGKRAVAIVQDLLTVARGVAVEKSALNLNHVVNGYLASPEHARLLHYHEDVVVRTELDLRLLNVKGAMVHIGKTLMNLVSNAAEAIEGGGEIIIKTNNRYLDQPLKGYEEVTTGEYVVMTVTDNGPGIAPKDLERIFEPFYTKKVMGRSGTGLGLAIVWNVMQEHHGYIDVTSNGGGTTFELYFPITREEMNNNGSSLSVQEYTGNGEEILVVDDVESQREIFCSMLEILGYRPTAVAGGEAAVEYLKENTMDLVILDMIMEPGINGRETYERILKIHPGQKAIIASGFAETDDVKKTQRLGAGCYIKKPVQLETIGMAIKGELSK